MINNDIVIYSEGIRGS